MALEPDQEKLLAELIEAERNVPRHAQTWHLFDYEQGEALQGPWGTRRVLGRDVYALDNEGMLSATSRNYMSGNKYVLTPAAKAYYAGMKAETSEPAERMEEEVRRFLHSKPFQATYGEAYRKWSEAEGLLWGADSEGELSTIGHKVREATQDFASVLVERFNVQNTDPDVTHVKRRLGAIVAQLSSQLGERRSNVLKAMADYWEATIDLIQRQEHSGQREAEPLTWSDGRRVVFHTAALMFEFAATLDEVAA